MSSSPKCHHRPTVIIAQLSSSPKCHHRPTIIIAQMSSSPKWHHRPNVIIAQILSSTKCHHRPNAIIAQMSSSPKCHRRSNVIIAQMPSSPKCHHRPMPSSPKAISIHFRIVELQCVWQLYCSPASILFLFLYLDISFRCVMVCKVRWILQSTTETLNHSFKVEIICNYLIYHVLHVLAHWRRLIIG